MIVLEFSSKLHLIWSSVFAGLPRSGQENLVRTWKVREKSGNFKINGYGRQSPENQFVLFSRGKDVLSLEIV